MKLAVLIAGLAGLLFVTHKDNKNNLKTIDSFETIVCFEQSPFEISREFEKTETNIVVSFKLFPKTDKKRSSDTIERLANCACKHLPPELSTHPTTGNSFNQILLPNSDQSFLQVFLL